MAQSKPIEHLAPEANANATPLVPKANSTLRACCFTLMDFDNLMIERLESLVEEEEATYVVFQREIAPGTGKEHLQGYIEFGKSVKWNKLNTLLKCKAHIEKRRGTPQQAAAYCKKLASRKPGTEFHESGVLSGGQGKRSDLLATKESIDSGATMRQVADEHFGTYIKYGRALMAYKQLKVVKRTRTTICIVLWGETRAGKSHLARALFPDAYYPQMGNGGVWYEQYEQQEAVIFEEFTGWIKFMDFKRIIDQYPFAVDTKGGQREFTSRYVIFTSNTDPMEWYERSDKQDLEPFKARLHFNLEARSRIGPGGPLDAFGLIVHKTMLPFNANTADGWIIDGLSEPESIGLLSYTLDAGSRKSLCDRAVTKSQVTKCGVILYPALHKDESFSVAARKILEECLMLRSNAHQRRVDEAQQKSVKNPYATDDLAWKNLDPEQLDRDIKAAIDAELEGDLPQELVRQIEQSEEDESFAEWAEQNAQRYMEEEEHRQRQAHFPPLRRSATLILPDSDDDKRAAAKAPPVRHDQSYRAVPFTTNYPGTGVDGIEKHGWPAREPSPMRQPSRTVKRGKQLGTKAPKKLIKRAPSPILVSDGESEDVGASMEEASQDNRYEEDSFLEDDMPITRKEARRLKKAIAPLRRRIAHDSPVPLPEE